MVLYVYRITNDKIVQGAVSYLDSIGLLTQANANLILCGRPSQ